MPARPEYWCLAGDRGSTPVLPCRDRITSEEQMPARPFQLDRQAYCQLGPAVPPLAGERVRNRAESAPFGVAIGPTAPPCPQLPCPLALFDTRNARPEFSPGQGTDG